MEVDATYIKTDSQIILHVASPRGAKWIAQYSTSNIADSIYYSIERGEELIAQMKEDGLVVQGGGKH